jgi:acetyl-CoA synthetase
MLPNRVEPWETMLAGVELGAVLLPTTMLVSSKDLLRLRARPAGPHQRIRHIGADAAATRRGPGKG